MGNLPQQHRLLLPDGEELRGKPGSGFPLRKKSDDVSGINVRSSDFLLAWRNGSAVVL